MNSRPFIEVDEGAKAVDLMWGDGIVVFREENDPACGQRDREYEGRGLRRKRVPLPPDLGKVWLTMWMDRNSLDDVKDQWIEPRRKFIERGDPDWQWQKD